MNNGAKRSFWFILLINFLITLFITAFAMAMCNVYDADAALVGCTVNGHYLKGRVQVVSAFGDVKIRSVGTGADLRVRIVDLPLSCGEWKFVDSLPDFTVEYVDIGEDITVEIGQ